MASSPLLDPSILISIFSAALQSVQTWFQVRDSKRAADAAKLQFQHAQTDPRMRAQADLLIQLVPSEVLQLMIGRVNGCWDDYSAVLSGEFLPNEVDKATLSIKACLCRELKRIYDLNGSIPEGPLRSWWENYCRVKH